MKILNLALKNSEKILMKYKNKLIELSEILFEKETILEKEFTQIMKKS